MPEEYQVSKYDRKRGGLKDVALWSKPSTIQNVETITGKSETFVITTALFEEVVRRKGKDVRVDGDYIFIECMDETGLTRVCLPPRVAAAIAAQHDSLRRRRRSATGRRLAQERKDRGEQPGFMKTKSPAKSGLAG